MAIISNTSPILNLAIVDSLHLLRQQFHQVLIPAIVRSELLPSSGHPGVRQIERAFSDTLIDTLLRESGER